MTEKTKAQTPPRENLVRAVYPAVELRANEDEPSGMPRLVGHFTKWNEWTEIDSAYEGRFMERFAPGAFDDSIRENRDRIRVLFQHGQDPQVGDKPLGPIDVLETDDQGVRYEVPLLDTTYNRDIIPGLNADLYGSSHRFSVVEEDLVRSAKRSAHNPDGLPERTVKKARLFEFGPVTFPAYAGATAGVRSMTDRFTQYNPRAESPSASPELQPERLGGSTDTPSPLRTHAVASEDHKRGQNLVATIAAAIQPKNPEITPMEIERMEPEQRVSRLGEIKTRKAELNSEYAGAAFPDDVRAEWEALKAEEASHKATLAELEERARDIKEERVPLTKEPANVNQINRPTTQDIYDLDALRTARSDEEARSMAHDRAKRAIEITSFPHTESSAAQEHVTNLLVGDDDKGTIARHLLTTGSPVYNRAFGKALMGRMLTSDEQRALSLTGSAGGNAVPFDLDPTIIPTSNGVVNPIRQLARVVQTTVDTWRGVSSGAITATYEAEATETTDNAPTLAQPEISTEKAQAFVPFSIEIGMDWGGLRAEMGMLLQDAKDTLEATKFISGSGTNEPFGVITGTTNTVNAGAGGTFTLANLYSLVAALPPRYRPRSAFVGDLAILNSIRQFDTVGSSAAIWQDTLQADTPGRLLGRPAYEASEMSDVTTAGAKFLLLGDFSRYVIVDRIGLSIELIPHLMGANRRPTGQRGLYAFWRNGAKVVDANAFRVLLGVA